MHIWLTFLPIKKVSAFNIAASLWDSLNWRTPWFFKTSLHWLLLSLGFQLKVISLVIIFAIKGAIFGHRAKIHFTLLTYFSLCFKTLFLDGTIECWSRHNWLRHNQHILNLNQYLLTMLLTCNVIEANFVLFVLWYGRLLITLKNILTHNPSKKSWAFWAILFKIRRWKQLHFVGWDQGFPSSRTAIQCWCWNEAFQCLGHQWRWSSLWRWSKGQVSTI